MGFEVEEDQAKRIADLTAERDELLTYIVEMRRVFARVMTDPPKPGVTVRLPFRFIAAMPKGEARDAAERLAQQLVEGCTRVLISEITHTEPWLNYIDITVMDKDVEYALTIQRLNGKRPVDIAHERGEDLDFVRSQLDELLEFLLCTTAGSPECVKAASVSRALDAHFARAKDTNDE